MPEVSLALCYTILNIMIILFLKLVENSGDSLTITVSAITGKLKIRIMMLIVLIFQTPIRRQMKAKQASAQSYGVTSSTARRILQSLEKLSSPLAVNYSFKSYFQYLTQYYLCIIIAIDKCVYTCNLTVSCLFNRMLKEFPLQFLLLCHL